MSYLKWVTLACMLLLGGPELAVAVEGAAPTPPASAPLARTALTYNLLRRCPALRIADEYDREVAAVIFLVGPSGVPSHPSLLVQSGSQELDRAAMSCVLKLRFQPATRLGDGTAVESWQQIRWKWAPNGRPTAASTAPPAAPVAAPALAQAGSSPTLSAGSAANSASAASDVGERHESASQTGNRAEVRVCVDPHGQLSGEPRVTHSSGDAAFDAAAVKIAQSGSGLYRASSLNGKPSAGCLQLVIAASGP